MKADLVAYAHSLGFSLCRTTPCVTPPHTQEFRDWLDAGRAGEMAWLHRNADRRTDPQIVLPGAQSVIVLAINYFTGEGVEKDYVEAKRLLEQAEKNASTETLREKAKIHLENLNKVLNK